MHIIASDERERFQFWRARRAAINLLTKRPTRREAKTGEREREREERRGRKNIIFPSSRARDIFAAGDRAATFVGQILSVK